MGSVGISEELSEDNTLQMLHEKLDDLPLKDRNRTTSIRLWYSRYLQPVFSAIAHLLTSEFPGEDTKCFDFSDIYHRLWTWHVSLSHFLPKKVPFRFRKNPSRIIHLEPILFVFLHEKITTPLIELFVIQAQSRFSMPVSLRKFFWHPPWISDILHHHTVCRRTPPFRENPIRFIPPIPHVTFFSAVIPTKEFLTSTTNSESFSPSHFLL